MKRLLIVDDEHHIVNWLAELFEEKNIPNLDILKTYSGKDALLILESTKIDILLLDIKMPGIDGLQVADKAISFWPNCRIILLTGYSNFEDIYYANKQKNVFYLLKTEGDEEILRAVSTAIDSIDDENKQQELLLQSVISQKLVDHVFIRNLLSGIFNKRKIDDMMPKSDKVHYNFPLQTDQPLFLLYGKLYSSNTDNFLLNRQSDLLSYAMQAIENTVGDRFQYVIYDYDPTTFLWFLQPTSQFPSEQTPFLFLKESFDDIISFYREKTPLESVLLLYPKEVSWENLYDTFLLLNQFAIKTFPLQCDNSHGFIYSETDSMQLQIESSSEDINSLCDSLCSQIVQRFSHGEYRQVSHLLKQLAFSSKNIHSMHHLPMIEIYQRIASLLLNYINNYNLSEQIAMQIALYPLYYINAFDNWRSAFNYLDSLTSIIFDLCDVIYVNNNQKLVSTIKNYVQSHLSENLNLTTLSSVVNYNSSYVSRIFKQTTGIKLSDYITDCRINKAKELLLSTDDSVSVISKKVGFESSQYLSTVFRDMTGMSPGEFRRQHLLNTTNN